jgi:ABC-2 type transport system ATP-binding protein
VLNEKHEVRKILGYLPQDMGIYPGVSAEVLLDHFAVLKGLVHAGERRDVVARLLRMTNLYEVRRRKLGSFSGGMRRRFGIAQALLGDPELIIVDEPTAGLDPAERARFLDLLSEIGQDTVVILSTHILDEVEKICPRLAILLNGRIVAAGEQSALVNSLSGNIWRKAMSREEAEDARQSLQVLTTRYESGRPILHVRSETSPGAGFEPVSGDLHDLYFAMTAEDEHKAA